MKTIDEWIDEFEEPVKDFDREAFGKVIEHIRQEMREACWENSKWLSGDRYTTVRVNKDALRHAILSAGKED